MKDHLDLQEMFSDTMQILRQGYYIKNGRRSDLKLSQEEMRRVTVLLPDEVEAYSR